MPISLHNESAFGKGPRIGRVPAAESRMEGMIAGAMLTRRVSMESPGITLSAGYSRPA